LPPLLKVPPKLGPPARHDERLVLNAVFHVVRNGRMWRLLPHNLPPWRPVLRLLPSGTGTGSGDKSM